ncbi:RNA-directed DNA polymerase, eukaryota [Tanacetum coccineum]
MPKFNKSKGNPSPYNFAANGASHLGHPGTLISPSPTLVLDDTCVTDRYFSKCVMGRVKDFNSIPNLQTILADEGFEEVKLFYLGGKWVLLEFDKVETKDNLTNHIRVNSWFNVIQDVIQDFISEERVVWVDIEGISLHAWSRETFARIGKKWGELLNIEDKSDSSFGRKRLCISTNNPVSILESFKIIVKGKVFMVRAKELFTWNPSFLPRKEKAYSSDDESVCGDKDKELQSHLSKEEEGELNTSDIDGVAEMIFGNSPDSSKKLNEVTGDQHSEDPFELYKLLNIKKSAMEFRDSSPSLSNPPGFTPDGSEAVKSKVQMSREDVDNRVEEVSPLISAKVMNTSQAVQEEVSGNSVGIGKDKYEGSVLGVLEEVIRVGQAMGYSMEGCEKDFELIIGNQGDDVVFR